MNTLNWSDFRSQFPALQNGTFLNTAGGGPMSIQAAASGRQYYAESENYADTYWDVWLERTELIRQNTAKFIGASAEDVAFIQSTSLGMNILAHQFPTPVRVLAVDQEFPSCTTPWLSAGHSLSFLKTPSTGAVTPSDLERITRDEADVFVLSSVQFANGYRANIREIGRLCRDRGIAFVVDATQSICAYDIDVERDHIDALVFSGYKWATAGYGIAVLSVNATLRSLAPGLTGWRSAAHPYLLENNRLDPVSSAIRHEMGHPAFPGIFTLGAALDLFAETGVSMVSERISELGERLLSGIQRAGYSIRSSVEAGTRSGILLIECDEAAKVTAALRENAIWVSARAGGIRASVHAYNVADEVDLLCDSLAAMR